MRAKAQRGVDSLQKCTPGISKKHSYCFSIWCNRGLLTRFNILVEVNPIFRLPFTGMCDCSLPCSEHTLDQMTQRGLSQPTSPPRSQFFLRQGVLCSAPQKRTRYTGQGEATRGSSPTPRRSEAARARPGSPQRRRGAGALPPSTRHGWRGVAWPARLPRLPSRLSEPRLRAAPVPFAPFSLPAPLRSGTGGGRQPEARQGWKGTAPALPGRAARALARSVPPGGAGAWRRRRRC